MNLNEARCRLVMAAQIAHCTESMLREQFKVLRRTDGADYGELIVRMNDQIEETLKANPILGNLALYGFQKIMVLSMTDMLAEREGKDND